MKRFKCKCGDCRRVCCHGWRIHLTETEHRRLSVLDCSADLRARMDKSFTLFDPPTADAYAYIHHGEDGRCPILNGDGLCTLHAECGEAVQPAVCRRYPRAVHPGHPVEMVCADSCEATVELLMEEPAPLPFIRIEGEIPGGIPEFEVEHEEERALRMRCIALLQEQGEPLEKRVEAICAFLGVQLHKLNDAELLMRVRELLLAFGRPGNSLSDLALETLDALSLRDGVTYKSFNRYREMRAQFYALFPEADAWYENLCVNHLFFLRFPQRDLAFAEACAILHVVTVCHTVTVGTKEAFVDAAAAVFRRIEHSNFYELAPHIMKAPEVRP